jgi:hypothetical protein
LVEGQHIHIQGHRWRILASSLTVRTGSVCRSCFPGRVGAVSRRNLVVNIGTNNTNHITPLLLYQLLQHQQTPKNGFQDVIRKFLGVYTDE